MTTTTRITSAVAALALATLALTGCVVENVPAGAQSPGPVDSAPAEESAEPDQTSDPGDGESEDTEGESDKKVNIRVEDGRVQYVRPIQNFSPTLERWVVDEPAGEITYTQYNCLGQKQAEGVAKLEHEEGGGPEDYEATWIGESPIANTSAKTVRLTITADELKLFADESSSRVEIEIGNFAGMCTEAGEAFIGFVF